MMETEEQHWHCTMSMGIKETRMLHKIMSNYLNMWEDLPEKDEEQKAYLQHLQNRFFAMITDYNYSHTEAERMEENDGNI